MFGQKYLDNLVVHVSNFSDTPRITFRSISRSTNRQSRSATSVSTAATRAWWSLPVSILTKARIAARSISSAGDFAPDNHFYFTLRRETPAKALIVEGASRGRSDSLHLQSALTTNEDLPFTFTLKSAGSVDPTSISDYSLVVLNDTGPISSALADTLAKFVNAGGQMIVADWTTHTDRQFQWLASASRAGDVA